MCWLGCRMLLCDLFTSSETVREATFVLNKCKALCLMLILALLLFRWGWVFYGFTYTSFSLVSRYKIPVCPSATFVFNKIEMFMTFMCNGNACYYSSSYFHIANTEYLFLFAVLFVCGVVVQSMIWSTLFSVPVPMQPNATSAILPLYTCLNINELGKMFLE